MVRRELDEVDLMAGDAGATPMDDHSAANRRPILVAHTISYSNPQELQVRITRLAKAAGCAS